MHWWTILSSALNFLIYFNHFVKRVLAVFFQCTGPKIIWIFSRKPSAWLHLSQMEQMQQKINESFVNTYLAQKQDIFHSICSNCNRLGLYTEIQIIFGTVYQTCLIGFAINRIAIGEEWGLCCPGSLVIFLLFLILFTL